MSERIEKKFEDSVLDIESMNVTMAEKIKMKALKRNKNAKEQGGYRKGKPSHKVGRRYPQKKRKIQR